MTGQDLNTFANVLLGVTIAVADQHAQQRHSDRMASRPRPQRRTQARTNRTLRDRNIAEAMNSVRSGMFYDEQRLRAVRHGFATVQLSCRQAAMIVDRFYTLGDERTEAAVFLFARCSDPENIGTLAQNVYHFNQDDFYRRVGHSRW